MSDSVYVWRWQFFRNCFISSHISSTYDAANNLFAFVSMSRDFEDLKYFLSLTSINKSSVADTFVLFRCWRLYKYFDLINLIIVFHRFSISVCNMYTNGRIIWNFFKNIVCCKVYFKWKVPNGIFFAQFFLIRSYLKVFLYISRTCFRFTFGLSNPIRRK